MRSFVFALALLFVSQNLFAADTEAIANVSLSPAGSFKAKSEKIKGEAVLKGDTVTAEKIVVDLKSLTTGIKLRDKHAKEKYLEVEKYPEAILTKAKGKGGQGTGRLKIKGIEKPVAGKYEIDGNVLKAEFPIKLSDYKITGIRYMGVGVDDEVTINITVPLKKK